MKLELISYPLCPFAQRAVIALSHKDINFTLTQIDIKNKPPWFQDISPLGKVPILIVDGKATLFESIVILEFINDAFNCNLLPNQNIERALARSWMHFSSDLFSSHYLLSLEKDLYLLSLKIETFFADLRKLEAFISRNEWFLAQDFSLIDCAWSPLFVRVFLSQRLSSHTAWSSLPRVYEWAQRLLQNPACIKSTPLDFSNYYRSYCRELGSLIYL